MAVVSTMILRSMRLIGEKTRGASLSANEAVECLDDLNTFIESLTIQRLMAYAITEDTHSLTASTQSYSIGPGATIDTTRPVRIVDPCFVRDSSGYDTPLQIINLEQYGVIVDKDVGNTYPTHIYYDGEYSATSTATLSVYPAPSASLTLHLNSWKTLTNFSTVTQTVMFPPGYKLMIESNFAIHLAAGFRPVSAELAKIARDSMAAVKSLNLPSPVARNDLGAVGQVGRNIFTGP